MAELNDITAKDAATFVIPDTEIFAYGIESIQIKKHVFRPGHEVLRGAIVQNPETKERYFVTDADLVRYQQPLPPIDLD